MTQSRMSSTFRDARVPRHDRLGGAASLGWPEQDPKSERDERVEEPLHCVEAIEKNAYQMRNALDEVVQGR
jgi:hypothetical protein